MDGGYYGAGIGIKAIFAFGNLMRLIVCLAMD